MPAISASDRKAATDTLTLLKECAGSDGRLSEVDIQTARRSDPALAPLVDTFVGFLRSSSKANGRSMVSMVDPLGTGEKSPERIRDQFLASCAVPPPAIVTQAPQVPPRLLPTPEHVSHLLRVLVYAAGADGRLDDADFAGTYARHPEDIALLAQFGTFLNDTAKARGEPLTMKAPGGEGVSRADLCDAFLVHLSMLQEPPEPVRPPQMGDRRPIPGTRDVNAPEQVFQYGQWLEFDYDPTLRSSGPSACERFNDRTHTWERGAASTPDAKAQVGWERANPDLAAKVRSRLGSTLAQLHSNALEEANDQARRAVEASAIRNAPYDPWATQFDNFAVRLRMNHLRVYNIITGNGGLGNGGGGRTAEIVDLSSMRVVGSSSRVVNSVDLPSMHVVGSRGDLVSRWVSDVDARWNAATGNNYNGGTFVYGIPGR